MFRLVLQRSLRSARTGRARACATQCLRHFCETAQPNKPRPWTREERIQAAAFVVGVSGVLVGVGESIHNHHQQQQNYKRELGVRTLRDLNQSEFESQDIRLTLYYFLKRVGKSWLSPLWLYKNSYLPFDLVSKNQKIAISKYVQQQAIVIESADSRLATPEFKAYVSEMANRLSHATLAANSWDTHLELMPDFLVFAQLVDHYRLHVTQFIEDLNFKKLTEDQADHLNKMKKLRRHLTGLSPEEKEALIQRLYSEKDSHKAMEEMIASVTQTQAPTP